MSSERVGEGERRELASGREAIAGERRRSTFGSAKIRHSLGDVRNSEK